MEIDELKATACAEVDRWADRLVDVAHRIHADPELAYEEHAAHDLADRRARRGRPGARAGARSACDGLPGRRRSTRARWWPCCASTTPSPDIGHACGHNVIAAAGLGAALAAAASGPGGRRSPRRAGHPGRGGRGREDRAGPARRLRRDRRRDDGPPGRRRPDPDGLHRQPAARGRLRGRGGPRRRRRPTGAATPSTPRCSATSTSPRSASTSARPSGCTASSRTGRRQAEHRARTTPPRCGTSARTRIETLAAAQGPGSWPASRPARRPPAAAARHAWDDRPYADMVRQRADAGRLRRQLRPARAGDPASRTAPAGWSARPTWATSATSCRPSTR